MSNKHSISTIGSDGNICTVTMYTIEKLPDDRGIWNTDTNDVLITEDMYRHFKGMTQAQQRRIFDSFRKITNRDLGMLKLLESYVLLNLNQKSFQ